MPNLCQIMPYSCQKVRWGKKCQISARKDNIWHNGRNWDYARMPNVCQNYAKMPEICQIYARRSGKQKTCHISTGKGRVAIMGANGAISKCQIYAKKCQIYAKMPYLCQIHARRPGKAKTCSISAGKGRVGVMGKNETISQCQSYANFMPKCQIYARFMPECQESQNRAIFRPERAESA